MFFVIVHFKSHAVLLFYDVSNDIDFYSILSEKIRSRRLKLAGHCIRHPELLANDLVTWEVEARRGRPKGADLGYLLG